MAPASATGEQEAAVESAAGGKSIDLDGLLSSASDRMTRLDPEPPAEFTFSWRGTAFSARFERHGQGCRLVLDGTLGAVPFSAENQPHRDNLLALLGGPQTGVPGRFWADRRLRLHFATSAEVEGRATGTTILGWTTLLLLRTAPWLEHAAALCVARPEPRRPGPV